jgi:hypothetical protein
MLLEVLVVAWVHGVTWTFKVAFGLQSRYFRTNVSFHKLSDSSVTIGAKRPHYEPFHEE